MLNLRAEQLGIESRLSELEKDASGGIETVN